MAKKKSKIPAYVLKQFDRALYKVGDKVVITWLRQIKQGHVTKFKKTNWGVSYTVDVAQESTKARNQITRYVKSRKSVTTATNTKSSSTRVRNSNTEIRSLDKAIDRQRDFLNGFVKK